MVQLVAKFVALLVCRVVLRNDALKWFFCEHFPVAILHLSHNKICYVFVCPSVDRLSIRLHVPLCVCTALTCQLQLSSVNRNP